MKVTYGGRSSTVTKSLFMGFLVLAGAVIIWLQVQWMNKNKSRFNKDASLQKFTRIIGSQTIRIYCNHCSGSGVVRDTQALDDLQICPVCFGPGLHFVRQMDYEDLLCSDCSGMGRLPGDRFGEGVVCVRCDGRGVVRADWDRMKIPVQQARCHECGGRGVTRSVENENRLEMCETCFGLGTRTVRKLDAQEDYCPACIGMGRLVDADSKQVRWCTLCGGRGLVVSHMHGEEAQVTP